MSDFHSPPDPLLAGAEDCLRALRLANPALGELGPVTWQAGFQVVGYNWQPWLRDCFGPELLPLLGRAQELAAAGMGRELVGLDQQALQRLSPSARESSGRAGRLLLRHGVPAGAKALQKITEAVEQQRAEGHLATIFAARCGIFSIPPRQMVFAYLYGEIRLGAPEWHDQQIFARMEEARPLVENWLREAAGTSARSWSNG